MSDPGTQLRSYLDQTVERVDMDDVFARARVRRQWTPHPLVNWHPAWIAVAAALIMVISIGAVAAGAWLLRGEPFVNEFATQPSTTASTGPEWPGVLILGLAIGGGTIALLAGSNALSNLVHRMRDRRLTMQTIETPERELARLREDNARLGSTKRSLIITLVIVLVAVAGAAAWLLVANAGTATEREITALIDDYAAAWAANDAEAVLNLMTEDGFVLASTGETLQDQSLEAFIRDETAFDPERVGDPIIFESALPVLSSGWLVAAHVAVPNYSEFGDIHEMDLFRIVEEGGRFLIAYHETWLGGE